MNFGQAIRIPDKAIWIQIPEYVFESEKVNFGQEIRIPDEAIWIQILEYVSGSEKVNFGQAIRIPISESFLNSEKVKNGLASRIPKRAIQIPCVKAADKSWIYTLKKKCIFLHDPNIFCIWIFLTKMKIRSKSFLHNQFQIVSRSFTSSKSDRKKLTDFSFQKAAESINWRAIRIAYRGIRIHFPECQENRSKKAPIRIPNIAIQIPNIAIRISSAELQKCRV